MSLLDSKKVQGREFRIKPPAPAEWPRNVLAADAILAASADKVMAITSGWLLDRPIYRLQNDKRSWLVNAADGTGVTVDANLALDLARASYSGPGNAGAPSLLDFTLETRAHKEPVWRVDFDDADDTSVYVSSRSGAVLEHRNSTWRLFDLFWMLHIMDYSERTNFNNPLLVSSAIGGLWMALTGVWLLFASIRLAEFVPSRWRRSRTVNLLDQHGTSQRSIDAVEGDTVFRALARSGLQLPSNCGGGQSCGLCEVRCVGKAPEPTSADRALLSPQKLAAGFRLACNLPVKRRLDIDIGNTLALSSERVGLVTGVKPVTPFLREITIRPNQLLACRPGSYVQVHVPQYSRDASHVNIPPDHHEDWRAVGPLSALANDAPVRRSYSVSVPVEQAGWQLTFLVRFMPGKKPGRGSGYMYTLKVGDEVRFSGPFGDFALKEGSGEKVFIGGGAGMAPLRAMIHDLLAKGAKEPLHFWYGARSLRDAPYVDEMRAFAAKHPNFHWHLVLSEEEGMADVRSGFVHEAVQEGLLQTHPDISSLEFYVCGPPAMLNATRAMLSSLGVDDVNVAYDDFKI
ncbi:2Fe-2S iron-sulfur cluster-binding protein [Massilia niastensis]|uniref:2Fe-2S iron-sulfur cluster-binding protein n=1 Tax=Massilia niastensis TaxID=544911 RepID=UPI00146A475C|nr:2Fe-2S iron-sulfur cluster-binding protein [Massilia niastensis]